MYRSKEEGLGREVARLRRSISDNETANDGTASLGLGDELVASPAPERARGRATPGREEKSRPETRTSLLFSPRLAFFHARTEGHFASYLPACRSSTEYRLMCFATGTLRSGMGRAANNRWHGLASQRAQRADRETRALSVAIPVSAYICR